MRAHTHTRPFQATDGLLNGAGVPLLCVCVNVGVNPRFQPPPPSLQPLLRCVQAAVWFFFLPPLFSLFVFTSTFSFFWFFFSRAKIVFCGQSGGSPTLPPAHLLFRVSSFMASRTARVASALIVLRGSSRPDQKASGRKKKRCRFSTSRPDVLSEGALLITRGIEFKSCNAEPPPHQD